MQVDRLKVTIIYVFVNRFVSQKEMPWALMPYVCVCFTNLSTRLLFIYFTLMILTQQKKLSLQELCPLIVLAKDRHTLVLVPSKLGS